MVVETLKIDVLHPQPKCFHDAQSTSVKQFDDELRRSIQKRDEPGHYIAGGITTGTFVFLGARTASITPVRGSFKTFL